VDLTSNQAIKINKNKSNIKNNLSSLNSLSSLNPQSSKLNNPQDQYLGYTEMYLNKKNQIKVQNDNKQYGLEFKQ